MSDIVQCPGCATQLAISPEARAYGETRCSQCGASIPLLDAASATPAPAPAEAPRTIALNIPAAASSNDSTIIDAPPPSPSGASDKRKSSPDSEIISLGRAVAGAVGPDPSQASASTKPPDTARLAEDFSFDPPGSTTAGTAAPSSTDANAAGGEPRIIAGYRLEKVLGAGSSADVYLAYHTDLGTPVTIRMLRGELSDHTENDEETFFKEARIRATISHPNIITIIDIGKDGDAYYLITEYVDGPRLEDKLAAEGAMTLAQAVPILLQICAALLAVQEQGLPHAVINPSNILIDKAGAAKAAVFGLTSLLRHDIHDAQDAQALERVKYMAPEQIADPTSTDPRSDLYSLGCIFYRMLCGRPPIDGNTLAEIHAEQAQVMMPDPRSIVPGLSGIAAAVMVKLMGKTPAVRFQSVAEAQVALHGLMPDVSPEERTQVVNHASSTPRGLEILLGKMGEYGASDLHLKAGAPPVYRINGATRAVQAPALTPEQVQAIVFEVLNQEQISSLRERMSIDFSMSLGDAGRFRMNVFRQRGTYSVCARSVASKIPTIEELLLPPAIKQIAEYKDGFVLVTGATGSGKSTSLASIIQLINQTRQAHILTIEDPLEYVHKDIMAIVTQREIGIDTPDFHIGLRDALRQDPDVILVGELRDPETVETAISASETGHLVMATLHANSATDAIGRLLNFFPPDQHIGLRKLLGDTLRSIVRQLLVRGSTVEHQRIPALEILFVNKVVRQCIIDGEDRRIPKQMREFGYEGMQDMNMSLFNLWKAGLITPETALAESPRPDELERTIKANVGGA